jgi:hypothetical protein
MERLRKIAERLLSGRDKLLSRLTGCGLYQPGHYYSPIPSLEEIRRDEAVIFGNLPRTIPGIELHEAQQIKLLEELLPYYSSMPFRSKKTEGLRYYFENSFYSYSDAILLHCIIRHIKPKRIIEVGSGFSPCAILDTNELFFQNGIDTTFSEPFPDRLFSLLNESDMSRVSIVSQRLQDVSLDRFKALEANDILFIDSTHVSKINSDVNRTFFDILPVLSSGVHIHFHDAFFPFEYPKEWFYKGKFWNEIYVLRSFLQYNSEFSIVLMNTFMQKFDESFFKEKMPLCLQNNGCSIWIRRN